MCMQIIVHFHVHTTREPLCCQPSGPIHNVIHDVCSLASPRFGDEDNALPLRPVVDSFDRSLQPVGGVNPVVELPAIWDTALSNGVRVLAVQNEEEGVITRGLRKKGCARI